MSYVAALRGFLARDGESVGPSPDDVVERPQVQDNQGRYLVATDPTQGASTSVRVVPVLTTTVIAAGTGLLMDTTQMGRVLVRESVTLQTGTDTAPTSPTT